MLYVHIMREIRGNYSVTHEAGIILSKIVRPKVKYLGEILATKTG